MSEQPVSRNSPRFDRTILGLFAASLAGGTTSTVFVIVTRDGFDVASGIEVPFVIALGSLLGGLILLPFTVLLGCPAHLALKGMRLTGAFVYVALGCVLGITMSGLLLFAIDAWPVYPLRDLAEAILIGGAVGGVGAIAFWFIRRPDRDLTPPPSPQT